MTDAEKILWKTSPGMVCTDRKNDFTDTYIHMHVDGTMHKPSDKHVT